ncbi:hypothetical protein P3S67_020642 [Capsicum chacoense]
MILGQGLFKRKEEVFAPLITFPNITNNEQVKSIANEVDGKVLMLLFPKEDDITASLLTLNTTGVLAFIVAISPTDKIWDYNKLIDVPIPFIAIDLEQGNQIFDYFLQCKSKIQRTFLYIIRRHYFKEKISNIFSYLKPSPDVAAPGVSILAAVCPLKGNNGFQIYSGTSMATPHVAGIVGLLKVAHPNWSPAAIKSALVTTAWNEDTYRSEIYSEGTGGKIADPFDFGGGICNPNGATDPGLVYDMDKNDYMNYLCSLGYSNDKVYNATTYFSKTKNSTAAGIICPHEVPSRLDLNLPSISIPNLKNSITVRRTVTNVGDSNSIYKLVVNPPKNTAIKVSPHILKFSSQTKKISFEVTITSTQQRASKFNFGSLAWADGKYFVRIPIAVRKQADV